MPPTVPRICDTTLRDGSHAMAHQFTPDQVRAVVSGLVEAGVPVIEVTFRTPAAREAAAAIATEFPDFLLGAGTLITAEMVAAAAAAGARFGVSPGTSAACLSAAAEHGLPFVPGAVTPSEVITCLDAGARRIKVFPAAAYGGVATLSALAGPFGWTGVRFMPTGGVRAATAAEYLNSPYVFAVGGTWIAPHDDIAAARWEEIGERARAVASLRPHPGGVADRMGTDAKGGGA
jgi:2-dehydro-3-deoxyphosphogluconate aldolase/(4S)-4-hydroxy-2-oxoglutarate aldolase